MYVYTPAIYVAQGGQVKMTIYLSDELHERVKADGGLNVSAVCQEALERELGVRQELAKQDGNMERVEVTVDRDGEMFTFAFQGTLLHLFNHGSDGSTTVYLTRRHRIAVHTELGATQTLEDFDSLDALEADGSFDPTFIATVAGALGDERPIELDI
jgi:post-segregation antitoxin (ccd killing protein)